MPMCHPSSIQPASSARRSSPGVASADVSISSPSNALRRRASRSSDHARNGQSVPGSQRGHVENH